MENVSNLLVGTGVELAKAEMTKDGQIDFIKNQLFEVSKYEVNEPRPGFEKPDVVTIYDDLGRYLGKAQKKYGIMRPIDFFNSIIEGLGDDYDFTKNRITYKEINDGKIIEFFVPIKEIVVPSTYNFQAEDKIRTYMICSTSFDGTQATRSNILTERLVCDNGLVVDVKAAKRSFRHTDNMNIEAMEVTRAMAASIEPIMDFQQLAAKFAQIKLNQRERNKVIEKITGYSVKDYAKLHRSKQNILDGINNGLEFEKNEVGANNTVWSLFNAFTYHTNHDLDGNLKDSKSITTTVGAGMKLNNKVQKEFTKMFA